MNPFGEQLLADHNEYRQSKQLESFSWCPTLQTQAETQLSQILAQRSLHHGHVPSNGLQNIASGKRNLYKPGVVVRLWLSDQGHAAPILETSFHKLGAAVHEDSDKNVIIVCNYSS